MKEIDYLTDDELADLAQQIWAAVEYGGTRSGRMTLRTILDGLTQ